MNKAFTFSFFSLRKSVLGTVRLHLAWMDVKVGADFETTVDISRGGRWGRREDSQKPTSQATEANTADTAGPPQAPPPFPQGLLLHVEGNTTAGYKHLPRRNIPNAVPFSRFSHSCPAAFAASAKLWDAFCGSCRTAVFRHPCSHSQPEHRQAISCDMEGAR